MSPLLYDAAKGAPAPLVWLWATIERARCDLMDVPKVVRPWGKGAAYHYRRKAFERARRRNTLAKDAWAYIFNPTRLEADLEAWKLQEIIPIERLRAKVREDMKGRRGIKA